MSLYKGNNKINKIYAGSTEIAKIYKGKDLIYQNKPLYYCYASYNQYFYFKVKVTEIKSYDLYYGGNSGQTKADSASDISYIESFTPDGIMENGFSKIYIIGLGPVTIYFYHHPEWDLYN